MKFEELNIIDPIMRAIKNYGYENPTPIQVESIPVLLDGKDLLGSAQTGTGKTAAFAIPILQNISIKQKQKAPRVIKALVLAPTRELAAQIGENFTAYGKYLGLRTGVIFGGVSQRPQTEMMKSGLDVLVATPGRLLDLTNQRLINLSQVEYFVLDEADRMLDMGFVIDVKKIIAKLPNERQTMLFSATMPNSIIQLANNVLTNPIRVAITPVEETVDAIKQSLYYVEKKNKPDLLIDLLKDKSVSSALVFSRTKHGANKIVKNLGQYGIVAEAIHGNKSQTARENALRRFKSKQIRVLIATDIAARGIDVDELSHVINFDLPEVPETYIHRIGRTGRAGFQGTAFSFCSEEELQLLKDIQKHIKMEIPVVENHKYAITFKNDFVKVPIKPSHRPNSLYKKNRQRKSNK